ncbi:MAG: hypothetical protein M3N50_05265 [Pseudomonadota bacterium]|nr:hypothetical protein [Pseudomonadota bacterium]
MSHHDIDGLSTGSLGDALNVMNSGYRGWSRLIGVLGVLTLWPAWTPLRAADSVWVVSKSPATQFNGTWIKKGQALQFAADPPMKPAAKAKFDALRPQDNPGARCTESGIGHMMLSPGPFEVIALDNHILIVAEYFHAVRRIWTDKKKHDEDPDLGFYGDSVVTWDGDTMVVDSIGFNGKQWLDFVGHEMSPTTHIVERWHMKDKNTLEVGFTFEDPAIYLRPWSATFQYLRKSTWRLAENSCDENLNNPDDPNALKDFSVSDKPQKAPEIKLVPVDQ